MLNSNASRGKIAKRPRVRRLGNKAIPYSGLMDDYKSNSHEFVVVSDSPAEHHRKIKQYDLIKTGESHILKELLLKLTQEEFDNFIYESMKQYSVTQTSEDSGHLHGDGITISFSGRRALCTFTITGDSEKVFAAVKYYGAKYEIVKTAVEWMYSPEGYTMKIPLSAEKLPIQEMYPFLDRTLSDYYTDFFNSSASILVLIGPPGTGKTTFLRGMLHHYGSNALVTYDASILAKDYIFANFLEGENDVMVIEDADNFLGNRTDGNQLMHKFLNVGDGLITMNNKKLIFSTNLPNVSDIDPALIRPGRCFDVLKFDMLDRKEAQILSDVLGIELKNDKENYTIGDIFHTMQQTKPLLKNKFGFV